MPLAALCMSKGTLPGAGIEPFRALRFRSIAHFGARYKAIQCIILRCMDIKILSAGRENQVLYLRNCFLNSLGYEVLSANSLAHTITALFEHEFDVVILCNSFTAQERKMLVELSTRYRPHTPIVLVSDCFDRDKVEQRVYLSSSNGGDLKQTLAIAVAGQLPPASGLSMAS